MDLNSSSPESISGGDVLNGHHIIYVIIIAIIIALNLTGNTATILSFWKVPALREKPGDLLILNLSIVDLGVGLVQIYIFPNTLFQNWPYRKLGCQFWVFFGNMFITMGIITTLAITYDRYLLIAKEYPKYVKIQSQFRIRLTVLLIWIYGIISGLLEIIAWDLVNLPTELDGLFDYTHECRSPTKYHSIYSLIMSILSLFGPILAVEALSILFICLLYRRLKRPVAVHPRVASVSRPETSQRRDFDTRNISANESAGATAGAEQNVGNPQRSPPNPKKRYRKATIVLGALVTVLNICILPYVTYGLITGFFCKRCINKQVRNILVEVIHLNSCINPFLYAVTMSKIRNFYKHILCGR